MWLGWAGLWMACRSPSVAAQPVSDAALRVAELGQEGLAAVRRCEGDVGVELRAWAPGRPLPVSARQVRSACGGAEQALERHFDALAGRYREALQPLDGLARVAEDARVLAVILEEGDAGPRLEGAVDHLCRALADERPAMEQAAAAAGVRPMDEERPEVVDEAELRRRFGKRLEMDVNDVGQLADTFDRHAHQQSDPRMVRRWTLRTVGAWAEATVARHRRSHAAWTPADAGAEHVAAAFRAYLDQSERLLEAWRAGLAAYPPGALPQDLGEAAMARLRAADGDWRAAREHAVAVIGKSTDAGGGSEG